MLCVIVGRVPGGPLVPIWVQETIVMHPDPLLHESPEGPYADIFLNVALRLRSPELLRSRGKEGHDFAFIHPGKITEPEDVSDSFLDVEKKWINDITPKTEFGPVKRGLSVEGRQVRIDLEPLGYRYFRFDVQSPLMASPVTCQSSVVYAGDERELPLFTLVRVNCEIGSAPKARCCITRMRFRARSAIAYKPDCVRFPVYGPTNVEKKLYDKIMEVKDPRRRRKLMVLFQEVSANCEPILYDVGVLNANLERSDTTEAYNHEKMSVFPVNVNGEMGKVGSQRNVHYFTSKRESQDFRVTVESRRSLSQKDKELQELIEVAASDGLSIDKQEMCARRNVFKSLQNNLDSME